MEITLLAISGVIILMFIIDATTRLKTPSIAPKYEVQLRVVYLDKKETIFPIHPRILFDPNGPDRVSVYAKTNCQWNDRPAEIYFEVYPKVVRRRHEDDRG